MVEGSTRRWSSLRAIRLALVPVALVGAAAASGCVATSAYAAGPVWAISSASSPTNFAAGDETGDDMYVLTVVDTGDESADGSLIEIADTLPSGLIASSISGSDLGNGEALSCSLTPKLGCAYKGFEVASGDVLQVEIAVNVGPGVAPSVVNSATVTSADAQAGASIEDPTTISSTPARFGVSGFAATWSSDSAGAVANLTAGFTLNQVETNGEYQPAELPEGVEIKLPPGVFVNANAVPRCTSTEFRDGSCEKQAAVGVVFASTSSAVGEPLTPSSSFVYNVVPEPGEPAVLMFKFGGGLVRLQASIGAEDDYRMSLHAENISEATGLLSMVMTLWGVPGAHDDIAMGPDHVLSEPERYFGPPGDDGTRTFLSNAGACESPVRTSMLSVQAWAQPAVFAEASSSSAPLTGCDRLSFDPSLSVVPDLSEAGEPAGYEVDVDVPQHEEPAGLASPDLKQAAVTLPEGAAVSFSTFNGLQGCSQAQVGLGSLAPVTCPAASKVGEVKVQTPLLSSPLEGSVFLASPNANPFGALLAVYLVAEGSGVFVKLAGQLQLNPVTGQLTIVFGELPQLPISELRLRFYGGERALLANPPACGLARATSELTPWSGNLPVSPSSSFQITSAAGGAPCSGVGGPPLPFSPAFQATSTTGETGEYDSLTFVVWRPGQEADLSTIAIQTPPAVQEMFTGVPSCGEPQASEGTCPTASQIGTVTLGVGPGPDPAYLSGDVYLTGPYRGSSQGLSIVVPFNAGPFELGDVVIRASEQIEPGTGRMRIESDPLPSIVDGIPLRLQALVLHLDRGEFELEPDGCEPPTITGTLTSTQGSSVAISADPLGPPSRCDPPQAKKPPVSAPDEESGVSPITATVSLAGTRIATTSGGEAPIKLRCTGTGTCRGNLTLTIRTKDKKITKSEEGKKGKKKRFKTTIIATATFSIPPGKTATVELELNTTGRALLDAAHGHLTATLTILQLQPGVGGGAGHPIHTHTEIVRLVRAKAARARKPAK
jgi:hypothetical protein